MLSAATLVATLGLAATCSAFTILNPSPSLPWSGVNGATSPVNYLRILRDAGDVDDSQLSIYLVSAGTKTVNHWEDYGSGISSPGVSITNVVSPGQWDIQIGPYAKAGTYTLQILNKITTSTVYYTSPEFEVNFYASAAAAPAINNCSLANGAATWDDTATAASLITTGGACSAAANNVVAAAVGTSTSATVVSGVPATALAASESQKAPATTNVPISGSSMTTYSTVLVGAVASVAALLF